MILGLGLEVEQPRPPVAGQICRLEQLVTVAIQPGAVGAEGDQRFTKTSTFRSRTRAWSCSIAATSLKSRLNGF
jgi:hypothetical protein